ncbi:MAG: hypothetical protein K1060chlam4_01258 [Candidatus Anoxychlamydiales bacterium]|nr:hypothetical protein [Candidatus Anoxychlamydiales bacterium]
MMELHVLQMVMLYLERFLKTLKHIGKYGTERQFPNDWVEFLNID